jgi:hypothetical protein|tara:strand:+ start:446 stop:565 length:120 start_codon:yes stop_codon:yes gene_type:complete
MRDMLIAAGNWFFCFGNADVKGHNKEKQLKQNLQIHDQG